MFWILLISLFLTRHIYARFMFTVIYVLWCYAKNVLACFDCYFIWDIFSSVSHYFLFVHCAFWNNEQHKSVKQMNLDDKINAAVLAGKLFIKQDTLLEWICSVSTLSLPKISQTHPKNLTTGLLRYIELSLVCHYYILYAVNL